MYVLATHVFRTFDLSATSHYNILPMCWSQLDTHKDDIHYKRAIFDIFIICHIPPHTPPH